MKFLAIFVIFGIALAEKPAPYPARGWKPQGQRLELPSRQYGTPLDPNRVEITTVGNEYGPPPATPRGNDDDLLQVQGLPAVDSFSQFRQQQDQQSTRFVINGRPFLLSPAFAPQREQLKEQKFQNPKNDAQRFSVNFGGNGMTTLDPHFTMYCRTNNFKIISSSSATSTTRVWRSILNRITRNSNGIPTKFPVPADSQRK